MSTNVKKNDEQFPPCQGRAREGLRISTEETPSNSPLTGGGPKDIIFIRGLKMKAYIGIHEWERQTLQTLVIDLELFIDLEQYGEEDSIASTINYQTVAERIKSFIKQEQPFQIVEALAKQLATLIKAEFPVESLRLTLTKPSVFPDIDAVGVTIER